MAPQSQQALEMGQMLQMEDLKDDDPEANLIGDEMQDYGHENEHGDDGSEEADRL